MNRQLPFVNRTVKSMALTTAAAIALASSVLAQPLPEWAQTYFSDQFSRKFASVPAENHDVWALLIIDTNAAGAAGLGIPVDGESMTSFLNSVFASKLGAGRHLHLTILQSDDVKESKITQALADFAVKPDDVLFVYYSGHGGYDISFLRQIQIDKSKRLQNEVLVPNDGPSVYSILKINNNDVSPKYDSDAGHFLATSSGCIYRWRLKNVMQAKHAQLNILITDCCANYGSVEEGKAARMVRVTFGELPRQPPIDYESKTKSISIPEKLVGDLFFRTVGWVSVQACNIGDTSGGSQYDGGLFSHLLLQYIAHPETINGGIRLTRDIDWQTMTFFATEEGTAYDPTRPAAENEELMKHQKRTKWTQCFAAGISRDDVQNRIAQSANQPPERTAGDFRKVTKVTVKKTVRGEFDGGVGASFQGGRNLHADERVDSSKPFCELGWDRYGRPDEHNKLVINAGQSYSAQGTGYVSTIQRGHTYTLLSLTTTAPGQRRFVDSKVVPNYHLVIYAPGDRDPTLADLRECCGDYIEISSR